MKNAALKINNVIEFKQCLDNLTIESQDLENLRLVKSDKTVSQHLKRIQKGKFLKNEINALNKLFTGARFTKNAERVKTVKALIDLTMEYAGDTHIDGLTNCNSEVMHFKKPMKISAEQTKFGKTWLKSYFFKLDGTPRSGKKTADVSERVLDIAKTVSRFEYIGIVMVTNLYNQVGPMTCLPVYRTYNKRGHYFDYSPIMWSAPLVMEGF